MTNLGFGTLCCSYFSALSWKLLCIRQDLTFKPDQNKKIESLAAFTGTFWTHLRSTAAKTDLISNTPNIRTRAYKCTHRLNVKLNYLCFSKQNLSLVHFFCAIFSRNCVGGFFLFIFFIYKRCGWSHTEQIAAGRVGWRPPLERELK